MGVVSPRPSGHQQIPNFLRIFHISNFSGLCPVFSFSIIFFSLLSRTKARKATEKKDLSSQANPHNPRERRENTQKGKEVLAKEKGKEFQKRKEKKIRAFFLGKNLVLFSPTPPWPTPFDGPRRTGTSCRKEGKLALKNPSRNCEGKQSQPALNN